MPEPSKDIGEAAFPMPGVSSGRVGMWPSAWPEAEQGQGGLLIGQRAVSLPPATQRGPMTALRSVSQFMEEGTEWVGRTVFRTPKPGDQTSPLPASCSAL